MRRIIVLLIVSIILISCEMKENRIYREKRERFEENCEELITKYNPIIIKEEFNSGDLIFTVELENKIISKNNQPIYAEVFITDIVSTDSSYIVNFSSDYWIEPDIYFTLDCEKDIGDSLLLNDWYDNDIVIIATIKSIKKIRFALDCSDNGEFSFIKVYTSDIFFAKGKLIDFAFKD